MERKSFGRYYKSFDVARFICIIMIIIQAFSLPIPYIEYVRPYLYIAPCILFTLYGYLVLRDDADLTVNIKHALKVFIIMFVIYGIITLGVTSYSTGAFDLSSVTALFTKRTIFNFLVLNYWPTDICSSIWYVQAILYALILCWLFRRLKHLDWLFCIILFIIGILSGEFASLVNFSFLGNEYLPSNFLTRVLPYMLLGRIVHNNMNVIGEKIGRFHPMVFFFIGIALAVIENFLLSHFDLLIYQAHMIGYILSSASLCFYLAVKSKGRSKWIDKYYPTIYKGMYYMCSPLGYGVYIIMSIFITDAEILSMMFYLTGVGVLIISFGVSLLIAVLKEAFKKYDKDQELYET